MDEDELDGMCGLQEKPVPTSDEDIEKLVLFADVNTGDTEAVMQRTHEWKELFNA